MTEAPAFHPWLQPKGFLEPFLGEDATVPEILAPRSPYPMGLEDLVDLFGWSPRRRDMIRSFLAYRRQIKALGLTRGFQWLDGSFLEHCEISRNAEPNDLDVVTWIPVSNQAEFLKIQQTMPDHEQVKASMRLDTYFAPCTQEGWLEPQSACYWFGLLGHTRQGRWKGIVLLDLAEPENESILDRVAIP